ncbi:hypothetical protein HB780_23260 [Rhizobium lusitanum]|uniref:hypothetical protein n=1 Tax=Rhizobium lusitanum TaxID=293958 RepID=UPI00160C16F6|nr:hypothetical protein [Rhizobium lusitanum]QND48509.1 hypothetical protein HB780_23260 [Rhizobium lusitanum]
MSFSEESLWDLINASWTRMSNEQRRFWDMIKLVPEEWELKNYSSCWVVGLIGPTVIYYNHFEYGFNRSVWRQYGVIEQYQSMQWELEDAIKQQLDMFKSGYDVGSWGDQSPRPGVFEPKP